MKRIFQKQASPLLLSSVLLAAVFLYLFRVSFSVGYLWEDFAWLLWSEQHRFFEIFVPKPGFYFRPFAAALPYWVFSKSSYGVYCWRLLSQLIVLWSAFVFWQVLRKKNKVLSFFLVCLWLFSPYQGFGIFYSNAFDYVLFPFILMNFLLAVKQQRTSLAILLFLFGLGVKELSILFPFLAFLYQGKLQQKEKKFFVLMAFVDICYLLLQLKRSHRVEVGGFYFEFNLHTLWENLNFLADHLLSARHLDAFEVSWVWFCFSLPLLAVAALGFLFSFRGWRSLLMFFLYLSPFIFLKNQSATNLAGIFWIFLLMFIEENLDSIRFINGKIGTTAFGVCAFFAPFYSFYAVESSGAFYRAVAEQYERSVSAIRTTAANCPRGDKIYLTNFDKYFVNSNAMEHLIWALRWGVPGYQFFLPGPVRTYVIPSHQSFYLRQDEAASFSKLKFEAEKENRVLVSVLGCDRKN